MRSYEEASAHNHLYELCHKLYLAGVTADTLVIVQAVPEVAATLPTTPSLDELSAAHHELFGFNLFPYESIFLGDEKLLGTAVSDAVRAGYHQWGYQPTEQAGAVDHIAEELGLLSYLCAAEMDAFADSRLTIAQRMQSAQRQFLEEHLLRWLVPFIVAVQRHDDAFFAEVATMTLALVAEHYQALKSDSKSDGGNPQNDVGASTVNLLDLQLPPAPTLVADPKTSLHDIAAFLTTPAYSGLYLSRYIINQLGRQQRLPRGFGSREQMLTNLLRTAAQYDVVPLLVHALQSEILTWQRAYHSVDSTYPLLSPFIQPWLVQIEQTHTLLADMEQLIINESD